MSANLDLVRTRAILGPLRPNRSGGQRRQDFRIAEVEEYRQLDDQRVLVVHRFTARGKSSDIAIEQSQPKGASLFPIRNGKVTRLVACSTREDAFADVGLEG